MGFVCTHIHQRKETIATIGYPGDIYAPGSTSQIKGDIIIAW
jgi:hypothetical protein